jgi:hypothetical protein
MYPNSEFLPRAPDPEEIILEGEETAPGPAFEGDSGQAEAVSKDDENKTELGDGEGKEAESNVNYGDHTEEKEDE